MRRIIYTAVLLYSAGLAAQTGSQPAALARTVMTSMWKDSTIAGDVSGLPRKWTYDQGVVLKGLEGLWYHTGDAAYFKYIQRSMDVFQTSEISRR